MLVMFFAGEVCISGDCDGLVRVVELNAEARRLLDQANLPSALGMGEQETIVEALVQGCWGVLDDVRARTAVVAMGAEISRIETLLIEAIVKGVIGWAEFEAGLLRLTRV
jgi:predicted nucleic acid-binding protein